MIRIALTKGRIEKKAIELLTEAGYDCSELEDKGRKLVFKVEAYDEKGLIGKGTHERFIVENKKFQEKTDNKLAK